MNKKEAISNLKEIKDFYGDDKKDGYVQEFVALDKDSKEAIDIAIEALQDDWIPVSDDTLPKDARPVLVYAWNVHHVVGQYKNMMNIDGEFEDMWVTVSAYDAPHKIEKVIAWKPLTIPRESDTE